MNTSTTTTLNKRAKGLFLIRDRGDYEGALFAFKHAAIYSHHLHIEAVAAVHRLGSRPLGHRGPIAMPEPYEDCQVDVVTSRVPEGSVTHFELDGYWHFWSIGARRLDSNIALGDLIERVRPESLMVNGLSGLARTADDLEHLQPALLANVDRVATGTGTTLTSTRLLGAMRSSFEFTEEIQQRLAAGRAWRAANQVARPGPPAPRSRACRESAPFDTELFNKMREQTDVTLEARGVQA